MKFNKLTIACTLALASSQVFAAEGDTFVLGTTVPAPAETIYISGASAQDKALAALVGNICTSTPLRFRDTANPSKKGKAYTSYYCTVDSSLVPGMSADKAVLINKRSAGGSGKGVQVVADGVALEAMNIDNGNCVETATPTEYDCSIAGGLGTGDLFEKVSDAGISDVEPALFVGPNVPPGDVAVTPSQIAKMDITSMNAVVFGVPLTNNLYEALQAAQGLTPGALDEANMPSLSSAQVNGLITGNIKKWDQLFVNGTDLPSVAGVTPPTDDTFQIPNGPLINAGPLVHVCRRVPGSGTQAQMNAVFANSPCAEGVQAPARAADSSPTVGPIIQENSGSGDVTVCMADKLAAGKWAVGVQSLEKVEASFKFPKIDGYAPTLKNVAENKYPDWVETTIQWRNAANSGPAGDVLAILNTIATDASTPGTIAALNSSFVHGFGTGAYLALNTNGHSPTIPHSDANPVTTATHAPAGVPNTCNKPTVNVGSEL